MRKLLRSYEHIFIVRYLLKWTLLVLPVALIVGSLVALFLWLLDVATKTRWQQPWLLFLLPVAGIGIHYLYKLWGKNSEAGNNLIMDEIHKPGGGVPAGMAPLVLVTTVVTHLFGGSAGREGTAVQIGGSMANMLGRWFKLSRQDMRVLLMTGVAAGFGAVFGTPLTGAIFAMEVLAIGTMQYDALIPCLIAGVFADIVCSTWGIHHTAYHISLLPPNTHLIPFVHFDLLLLAEIIAAGIFFGLAGRLFAWLVHRIKSVANKGINTRKWLIPVTGGVVIIMLTYVLGTDDYLGLGVLASHPHGASIVSAFVPGGVGAMSWFWKLLFTAITLGTGFKGGEVTPLFFIGAALGNTLAIYSGAPVDLFAGLGFIAVFAGATNTPIACTIMGIELFGADYAVYYAIACFTAYYFSGHVSIYDAQRVAVSKFGKRTTYTGKALAKLKDYRNGRQNRQSSGN